MAADQRFIILSDTHVGDRARRLDPGLLEAIKAAKPDMILHCGDACKRSAIEELEKIAPVTNVQGNRDWFQGHRPPMDLTLEVNGCKITLAHGHISMWQYLMDKARLLLFQIPHYQFFRDRLIRRYPEADLILYGHTHVAADDIIGKQRLISVGAGYPNRNNRKQIEYGLLTVKADGSIDYEHHAIPARKA